MGGNHDHTIDPFDPAPGTSMERPLRIGVGGPVGTGKTTLVASLCELLRDSLELVVVTNDIFTSEDAEALRKRDVLAEDRIVAVQTGCCPHTAIRDDISANLSAMTELESRIGGTQVTLLESGGDNLTAIFSQGLVDLQIFVIDACGGDDIPRKGGPGISKADLLVVNKIDLAHLVGSDLTLMESDATERRSGKPTMLVSLREPAGAQEIATWVTEQYQIWNHDDSTQSGSASVEVDA